MISDFLNNLKDYADTRLKNPFLGTLVLVWIFRNFEFLYALFNFEEDVTLRQRIDYIRRYFQHYDFWHCMESVGIAFGLMALSFILLLFARALTNGYSIVLNYLNDKTDKGSVVSRKEFEHLKKQFKVAKGERDQLRTEAMLHDETVQELNSKLSASFKNETVEEVTENIDKELLKHINEEVSLEKLLEERAQLINENTGISFNPDKIQLPDGSSRAPGRDHQAALGLYGFHLRDLFDIPEKQEDWIADIYNNDRERSRQSAKAYGQLMKLPPENLEFLLRDLFFIIDNSLVGNYIKMVRKLAYDKKSLVEKDSVNDSLSKYLLRGLISKSLDDDDKVVFYVTDLGVDVFNALMNIRTRL